MRLARYAVLAGLILAPQAARAQSLAQAQAFVEGLYAAYRGDGPDYLGRQARSVFAPPLLALIRRDQAHTPKGDAPELDGDPICDCQDFEISRVVVRVTLAGVGQARAAVEFRNFTKPQHLSLDLAAVGGRWRVADVHGADTPSLVAFLRQSLKRRN